MDSESTAKKDKCPSPEMFEGKVVMPFERALMLMREGKKVQNILSIITYYIKDGLLYKGNKPVSIFPADYIINGKWILVD